MPKRKVKLGAMRKIAESPMQRGKQRDNREVNRDHSGAFGTAWRCTRSSWHVPNAEPSGELSGAPSGETTY